MRTVIRILAASFGNADSVSIPSAGLVALILERVRHFYRPLSGVARRTELKLVISMNLHEGNLLRQSRQT